MASVALRNRVTEAEFLALPETVEKTELIDGEVIASPSPDPHHQRVLLRLASALAQWERTQTDEASTRARVMLSPSDLRIAPGRIVQPDLYVVRGPVPKEGPVDLVPLLCVEILSRNTLYDRVTKRYLYADAGVPEYWVIETAGLLERRTGPRLATCEDLEHGRIETPRLPGFSLDLAELFAED